MAAQSVGSGDRVLALGEHNVLVGSTDYDPFKGPRPRHLMAYENTASPRAEKKEQVNGLDKSQATD